MHGRYFTVSQINYGAIAQICDIGSETALYLQLQPLQK
jgi:hypothetical protein